MLLMKADVATVYNYGIRRFNVNYFDYELSKYIGQKVGIKWDIDDVTKLYVYDQKGRKICEATSAVVLSFGRHVSQEALEKHMRDQKRQIREAAEFVEERITPYEARLEEGRQTDAVGKIDLTIKAKRNQKVVTLPIDKEFRQEQLEAAPRRKKAGAGDEYLAKQAEAALARLRAINE